MQNSFHSNQNPGFQKQFHMFLRKKREVNSQTQTSCKHLVYQVPCNNVQLLQYPPAFCHQEETYTFRMSQLLSNKGNKILGQNTHTRHISEILASHLQVSYIRLPIRYIYQTREC